MNTPTLPKLREIINKATQLATHQILKNGITDTPTRVVLETTIDIKQINPQLVGLNNIDESLLKHIETVGDLACVLYGYALGLEEVVLLGTSKVLKLTQTTPEISLSTDLTKLPDWNFVSIVFISYAASVEMGLGSLDYKTGDYKKGDVVVPSDVSDITTPGHIFLMTAKNCFDKDYAILVNSARLGK